MMKKKVLAVLLITLLLLSSVSYGQDYAGFGEEVAKILAGKGLLKGIGNIINPFARGVGDAETATFLVWLKSVVNSASEHYSRYLAIYVLINPNPLHPQVMGALGFFISLALSFYVVVITFTGFYLLFVSGSARGRAKAKYSLGKLIIGMVLLSISPQLLYFLFQFSGSLTQSILNQADTQAVSDEFSNTLRLGYKGTLMIMSSAILGHIPVIKKANLLSEGGGAIAMYPFFLIVLTILFTFGLLIARYLTVMIWTILFPLTIFFTSFEYTKDIGRVMMEQTLQWTFFQVFYALTLVGLSVGLTLLPEGYQGYSVFSVAFQSIAVFGVLFLVPWYFSSLLQRLFPP